MWITSKPIIALAPMADMTDSPFCRICREVANDSCHPELVSGSLSGRGFVVFREMVSSEAVARDNAKTLRMCEFDEIERPIVLQLFGSTPKTIRQAARILVDKFSPDGIDINMGCPVPKITGKVASGAVLMKDYERAMEIVRELKKENLGVPVSVKTRLGWGKEEEILEFAPKLEAAGADAISIHGRTKTQGYSGKANWEMIGKVKKLVSIPVIANGDIDSREDIQKCLSMTGADGVMIGRGALGNPWVFSGSDPTIEEIKKVVLAHARLHVEHYGEGSIVTFRKHLAYYFKGGRIPGVNSKKIRGELMKVKTVEEIKSVINMFRD